MAISIRDYDELRYRMERASSQAEYEHYKGMLMRHEQDHWRAPGYLKSAQIGQTQYMEDLAKHAVTANLAPTPVTLLSFLDKADKKLLLIGKMA